MTSSRTGQVLDALAGPLRRRHWVAWTLGATGAVTLVLGGWAWLVRLGVMRLPLWVFGAWAGAVATVAGAIWVGRRRASWLAPGPLARTLETTGRWRTGAITSLLAPAAAGTSAGLLGAADAARADELDRRAAEVVGPIADALQRRAVLGAGVLAAGLGLFLSAGPRGGTAAALFHPVRAWEDYVAPVRLSVDRIAVDRGDSATLSLEARGRPDGTLWTRAPGEEWRPQPVAFDAEGRATRVVGPLGADLYARLTSGDRSSDTVVVRVRIPAFLGTLAVTARYPAYLSLDDEPLPTGGDTVVVPAGTRLETRGEATAALARASWGTAGTTHPLDVADTRFSGSFTPAATGVYELALATAAGAPLAGDPVRLPLRVVADSLPVVEIPVPGADTIAPVNLILPIVIDARDDHGLQSVVLESRRMAADGQAEGWVREPAALPAPRADRALLTVTLDLNRRGLQPGDTLRYRAVAQDHAPRGGVARSREYTLRLLTLAELRSAERAASQQAGAKLDSVLAASRKLERQTEDLARERPRAAGPGGQQPDKLSFQDAQKAEAVARDQQALMEEAEDLARRLDELGRQTEAAGVGDTALQRRLDEVREMLQRAVSPELREKLAQLQQALKNLDPAGTRQSLEELAEAQQKLREALERSKELFRRAALEGDLANLAEESKDLAEDQRQWNEAVAAADSMAAARQEAALAQRADSLASALEKLARQLAQDGQQEQTESGAKQARQAAQQMKDAAQAARSGQKQRARQQGQQAQASLEPLGEQLEQQRQELQQEWREDVTGALDRLLAETTRLTERQLAVADRLRRGAPGAQLRGEQGVLEDGTGRLVDQALAVAGKNALVSGQIAAALTFARKQMTEAREALASATGSQREAAERAGTAVDALNAAAYAMLRSRQSVSGSSSGSGMAEAMQQMAQMANRQGQLNQQAQGLMPQAGNGGVQEQLRQLAMQQRALSQQLERLRAMGNAPGAGEMAQEARELARRLEAGRLDRETVDRQERLFRRMLDAGRTLQGQEEDEQKERESTTARGDNVALPPALRRKLSEDGRPRMPSWEELQRFTPEERRLVIDYFRRLAEAP